MVDSGRQIEELKANGDEAEKQPRDDFAQQYHYSRE